jgi:hypothetical protein
MLQWLQPFKSTARSNTRSTPRSAARAPDHLLLQAERLDFFPQAIACRVISDIGALQKGRVMLNGYSWRAKLDERACQVTLLPGQSAWAIGRQGLVLIVVPDHCLTKAA